MSRTYDIPSFGRWFAVLSVLAAGLIAANEAAAALPPGNSAVNQYTEAFPTPRGDKDAHDKSRKRSPKNVLGKRNAEKLRQQGSEGEAVADLTVETAPADAAEEQASAEEAATAPPPARGRGDGPPNGGNGRATVENEAPPRSAAVPEPDGSSGLAEVLSRATGSPSGEGLGIFLPLLLVATILWAFAYLARQRRPAG